MVSTPPVITVAIPVWNAFPDALRAVKSVIATLPPSGVQLLIIDDCSPHGSFEACAKGKGISDPRVTFRRLSVNRGFVGACNVAFHEAPPGDLILLNSDTEVAPGWIDGLVAAAHSRPDVGTVTPLTNNGTICSVPEWNMSNELPCHLSVAEMAKLVARVSTREYPVLPTCVGFCVLITERCRRVVQGFDPLFGKGYGEENDLSLRAQRAGLVDLLDDATFVYHAGSKSFAGEATALQEQNLAVLVERHPDYLPRLRKWIASSPLQAITTRIYRELFAIMSETTSGRVLHLLHNGPRRPLHHPIGGTEHHVAGLIDHATGWWHWSLVPAQDRYILTAHSPGWEPRWEIARQPDALFAWAADRSLFSVVHLHHSLGFPEVELHAALASHGRVIRSYHDMSAVCPRTNCLTPDERLCSLDECTSSCGYPSREIIALRHRSRELSSQCAKNVFFSTSSLERIGAGLAAPIPKTEVIPHGTATTDAPHDLTHRTTRNRVALIGNLGPPKGAHLIKPLLEKCQAAGVELHLFGRASLDLPSGIHDHGPYDRSTLPSLLRKAGIDLVIIPSLAPETYCLTLDEAWGAGIPVVVTPRGALAERVTARGGGWVADAPTAEALFETTLRVLHDSTALMEARRQVRGVPLVSLRDNGAHYSALYQSAAGTTQLPFAPLAMALVDLPKLPPFRSWRAKLAHHLITAVRDTSERYGLWSSMKRLANQTLPEGFRQRLRLMLLGGAAQR